MAEAPSPEQQPLFDSGLPASASLLFYLFAERVVPTSRLGTKAPIAGIRVDSDALACALFAVSFWELREAEMLSLHRGGDSLRVTLTSTLNKPHKDGIEAGLLDVLTPGSIGRRAAAWESLPGWVRGFAEHSDALHDQAANLPNLPEAIRRPPLSSSAPPATVTAVVTRWYGSAVRAPETVPMRWTQREAEAKGYIASTDAKRNPIAALFLGKMVQAPVQQKVATAESAFVALAKRWHSFRTEEPAVYRQLEQEIAAGIAASLQTSSGSSA